jgi:hypothetical protein
VVVVVGVKFNPNQTKISACYDELRKRLPRARIRDSDYSRVVSISIGRGIGSIGIEYTLFQGRISSQVI